MESNKDDFKATPYNPIVENLLEGVNKIEHEVLEIFKGGEENGSSKAD